MIKEKHDERGNSTYMEYSDGSWVKWEYDERGNPTYMEYKDGDWQKWEYDERGQRTYTEDSDGNWTRWEYDKHGNCTYFTNSSGYWCRQEYDEAGSCVYYEDVNGKTIGTPLSGSSQCNKVQKYMRQFYETLSAQDYYPAAAAFLLYAVTGLKPEEVTQSMANDVVEALQHSQSIFAAEVCDAVENVPDNLSTSAQRLDMEIKRQYEISSLSDLKDKILEWGWRVDENIYGWLLSKVTPENEDFSLTVCHNNKLDDALSDIQQWAYDFGDSNLEIDELWENCAKLDIDPAAAPEMTRYYSDYADMEQEM
ncbi:MAG: hypothetical protein LUH82_07880 [Clostridiales bacterium]|nr:hypothetical protein [Clostridiales bacterium]